MSFNECIFLHTGGQTYGIIFDTTYNSVDVAHREIVRAKVGKGGKMKLNTYYTTE